MENSERVAALRKLPLEHEWSHPVFEWMSGSTNWKNKTDVGTLERKFGQDRRSLVSFLKSLEALGLGRFRVGRRGAESRFEYYVHVKEIGQAALGEIDTIDLDQEQDGVLEEEDVIALHRQLLAHALGRNVEAISITVDPQ